MVIDGELSNLYCVWPLNLIELTGVLGNNAPVFYYDWFEFSMTFSLLVQSAVMYTITLRLMHKKNM